VALKNLPGSLADVEKSISLNPNYAPAYQLRGTIRRKMGEINSAIASFQEAAKLYLNQKDTVSCRRCLELIEQIKLPSRAISNLTPTPSPSPSSPLKSEDFYQQVLHQAKKGEIQRALEELNWVLQLDSQDAKAYLCRGTIHKQRGDAHRAIADFNQALRLNPQDEIAYRHRGQIRLQLGDYGGAIADLNQALELNPQQPALLAARGEAYCGIGNYQAALDDYTQALTLNPARPSVYLSRAQTYLHLEEIQKAIADYQMAASKFCEQEDWQNYQKSLDSLKKLHFQTPQTYTGQLPANPLRQRLLMLVGGYWEIVERLPKKAKEDYPGMPEDWYLHKVVRDLERDRA
jgi:tetratricopeptide (TPR) repeat protein